jgi:CheY-like chemotaxis protein
MKILIVDDDEFLQKTLSFQLLQAGYTVSIAKNGQAALDALEKDAKVDVIICDVNMPQLTGPSFILTLKKIYPHQLPKIVIVSGIRDGVAFMKQLDIKYDQYYEKPIDSDKMSQLLSFIASM